MLSVPPMSTARGMLVEEQGVVKKSGANSD